MNKTIYSFFLLTGLTMVILAGCKKDNPAPTVPVLTTSSVSGVSFNTATSGGTITSNGGATITASGICWSNINTTPTITDSLTQGTTTSGGFTTVMNNLKANTTYYVRAYATNSVGTGYGNAVTFSTTVDTTKVTFAYNGATVTYGVIVSPTTARKWMDRNLGASEVATATNDSLSYGDLFQWGRLADGHQLRTSATTTIVSSSDAPGNSSFILFTTDPNNDWRNPQNDNLWQGSHGTNNPCPTGWHVPTNTEWYAETGITDANSGFNVLKLPLSGYRSEGSGLLKVAGTSSYYWTSTTMSLGAGDFNAKSPGLIGQNDRAIGEAVRCIKD